MPTNRLLGKCDFEIFLENNNLQNRIKLLAYYFQENGRNMKKGLRWDVHPGVNVYLYIKYGRLSDNILYTIHIHNMGKTICLHPK